jgi:hypothetical protein
MSVRVGVDYFDPDNTFLAFAISASLVSST